MSLLGILSSAREGMAVQSASTTVTSQNVAGATSPEYARRRVIVDTPATGGVRVIGVSRSSPMGITTRLNEQVSLLSAAEARESPLAAVQTIVAPATGSLDDRMSSLFSAFAELSQHPTDQAVRGATLHAAQSVAEGFRSTADELAAVNTQLFYEARAIVGDVNERLGRLAQVQAQVERAQAIGESPVDLLDRRDALVREIAERVGARTVEDERGRLTLFGAGGVLLNEGRASTLMLDLDAAGALRVSIRSGDVSTEVTGSLTLGALGGVRQARDVDLVATRNELDALAVDFASTINAVYATGVAPDGTSGHALFTITAGPSGAAHGMNVDAWLSGRPDRLAAAESVASLPGGGGAARGLHELASAAISSRGNYAEAFASLVTGVGERVSRAQGEVTLREDAVAVALLARESGSGVSVDEEMLDLARYQRAFEATTKIIGVVDELFETLLRTV